MPNCPGRREVGNTRGAKSTAPDLAPGAPTTLSTLGLPAEVHLPQQGDCGHQLLLVQASSEWRSPCPLRPSPVLCWAGLGSQATARPSSATTPSPQYHSKVSCFMLQQIEEPCSLGVHAAVVIPPTWILRARRPQVSPACTRDTSYALGACQPPHATHLVTNPPASRAEHPQGQQEEKESILQEEIQQERARGSTWGRVDSGRGQEETGWFRLCWVTLGSRALRRVGGQTQLASLWPGPP